jgi:hypothetical protein
LEAENDSIIFEKSSNILGGSNGIIYLLFLGRDNYARQAQGPMKGTLFTDNSNVNQVIGKLLKETPDFLISKGKCREEGKRGRERNLYTANINPIIVTLKAYNIKFDQQEIELALKELAETGDFFPQFLINMFKDFIIRRLPWQGILSQYFYYLSEVMRANKLIIYPMPSHFSVNQEKIDEILKLYPNIRKNLFAIAMQLSSPMTGINPEFKNQINKSLEALEEKDSELMKFLTFLQELKKMGVTDFSALVSQTREVIGVYEKLEEIKAKLKQVEEKLDSNKK